MHTNLIIENISKNSLTIDMLRLDLVHPIISGNKWFKLKYYLEEAASKKVKTIASFGGPYSNHIVALAHAAKINNLKSIGYIRSNAGESITPSIQQAIDAGMDIRYLGRTNFQENKEKLLQNKHSQSEIYFVDEGGYGALGAKGISELFSLLPLAKYDYIVCAVGTGTMLAGLINGSAEHQNIIGIPVLKNEESIADEIRHLLIDPDKKFQVLHEFHQGGYAKTTPSQIQYMNQFWEQTNIPTDIVYTGKLVFAVHQLVQQKYFKENSSLLMIHSGGLQGNRSLKKGVLQF